MDCKAKLEADGTYGSAFCGVSVVYQIYAVCYAGVYLLWYAYGILCICLCIYERRKNRSVGWHVCDFRSSYVDETIHDCISAVADAYAYVKT